MNKKLVAKRTLSLVMSMAVLSSTAFAAVIEHDISMESLHITDSNYNKDGYKVTGSSNTNTIKVETSKDKEVNITLDNVNIKTSDSAIDAGESNVTLNIEGENTLSSMDKAAIHVSSGELTITSDSEGQLTAENDSGVTESAGIGSNENEDMSGSITIEGNVKLKAESDLDGAGIGSGQGGHMSGSITIQGDAEVDADSDDDGAGIGSGYHGNMSGSIIISGNSKVYAFSDDDGAGIGSGEGGDVSGSIFIGGNADVKAEGDEEGAGIGAGNSDLDSDYSEQHTGGSITSTGSITITDNAKVHAVAEQDGAGIGVGETTNDGYYDENDNWIVTNYYNGKMNGSITISGNAEVIAESYQDGAGIGSSQNGKMNGTISILDNAKVTASSNDADDDYDVEGGYDYGEEGSGSPIGEGLNASTGSNAAYYFGEDVTINDMSGADLDALIEALGLNSAQVNPVAEKASAASLVLWNEAEDIKAIVYGANALAELIEAEIGAENLEILTADVAEENLLRTASLSFDAEYEGRIVLWFYLGEEYAGQTVEIRTLVDGETVVYEANANSNGVVRLQIKALGDFAIVAK